MKIKLGDMKIQGMTKWNLDLRESPFSLGDEIKLDEFKTNLKGWYSKLIVRTKLFIDNTTYFAFKSEIDLETLTFKVITKPRRKKLRPKGVNFLKNKD